MNAHHRLVKNLAFVFMICAVCALYYFLLNQETRGSRSHIMAMAYSASRVAASHKPFILYGTAWKKERTASLVSKAVHTGFRFIDTACQPRHYNEPGVGLGWFTAAEDLGLQRSDFFLQTKFTPVDGQDLNTVPYDPDMPIEVQVKTSLEVSLKVSYSSDFSADH